MYAIWNYYIKVLFIFPFVLQFPPKEYFQNYHNDPDIKRDMEEMSYKCIVKVMIPTERFILPA